MRVFDEKERCSGCTACMNSCPVGAISMIQDEEGFLYPEIDEGKCIHCGLCRKICPFHGGYDRSDNFETPLVYAVKHADEKVREASTSGGMFTALSDFVLAKKGIVYGAAFSKPDFKVHHIRAETVTERDRMRGSKYVQSEIGMVFPEIKSELEKGRDVLFTGTPCQVAGLKAYLGDTQYEKLILCDLVCHGTPSPLIWNEYVVLLQQKRGKKLTDFKFRDKSLGWHNQLSCAYFQDGVIEYGTPLLHGFLKIFFQHVALRPSCHNCPFTNIERTGDITIADFWGVEKQKPEFDDDRGVSLLLVNTKKGNSIIEQIKQRLIMQPSSIEECVGPQVHLKRPAEPSPKRDVFWNDFNNKGMDFVLKKYTYPKFSTKMKRKIIKPLLVKIGLFDTLKKMFRH